ncbi:unnamed protein product [Bemisia tabaci]|uniref:BZIP domain-containing protein n=1 Tax=Bemisia tabaci TaxID=7038 RepID=A0A9P0C6H7_BEMTA|nr:PREDICTED: uncharacterized protein LOC109029683 isoform X2 [Bemisia tabaci]CAH0775235.1 unnamed protein product [Bemisia tabaci]
MAKVSLKSDEDSAVECSKSTSESDQSPREDLYRENNLNLLNFTGSESDFSEDDGLSFPASSPRNMVQSSSNRSARSKSLRIAARKGRKRSIEDDESILEEELSRASHKHQSKNAINARINRIKKKKYMQSLEESLDAYKNECKRWQAEYRQKSSEVQVLQKEVEYLKAVLRNESKLGAIVKNLKSCGTPVQPPMDVDFTNEHLFPLELKESFEESSLFSLPTIEVEDSATVDPDSSSRLDDIGICLHVSTVSGISMEFCSHCAKYTCPELLDASLRSSAGETLSGIMSPLFPEEILLLRFYSAIL